MPTILSKPSGAAPTSLISLTIGAVLTVWSGLWFFYFRQNLPAHDAVNFIDFGLLLTVIALLAIGFTVGRPSRQAELLPIGSSTTSSRTRKSSDGSD